MILSQRSPTFLAPGTGFRGRQFFHGRCGAGRGVVQAVMRAMDEALLSRLPLTSCCAARFLTGRGPLSVRASGLGDPCIRPLDLRNISRIPWVSQLEFHIGKTLP